MFFPDNFDDLFPQEKRPTTYMNEIIGHRQPIFGRHTQISSETNESDPDNFYGI